MRIDDVYVITPYDSSEALTDILESSSYISKISLSSNSSFIVNDILLSL